MKTILFESPVNKGETFTFEQLFSIDENVRKFDKYIDEQVAKQLKSAVSVKTEEIRDELNKRTELEVKERKLKLEEDSMEEVSSLKAQLKMIESSKEETIKSLKDDKETINKQLENISTVIRKQFEERLQEINSAHSKEKQEWATQLEDAKKATSTIGATAEDDVRDSIRNLFPSDTVRKPNHATGEADVEQTIVHEGKEIANVYYEVKNRKNWSRADYENFADKVRKEAHDYNIYIGKALPKKSPETFIKMIDNDLFYDEVNNVYITSFENWKSVIYAVRNLAVQFSLKMDVQDRIEDIKDKVYEFIKGPDFANYFSRIQKLIMNVEKIFKDIQKQAANGIGEIASVTGEIDSLNANIKALL